MIIQLLSGENARFLSSLMVYPVILLMWLITLKLYTSRRKVPYLSLAIALFMVLVSYSYLILNDNTGLMDHGLQRLFYVLHDSAYILLMLGFYQLYNLTTRRTRFIFYGLSFIPLLLVQFIRIETIFMLLFAAAAWYLLAGSIGRGRKFQWSIIAFVAGKLMTIVLILKENMVQGWLVFGSSIVPLLLYSILFFILFERVIEIMQASYQSSITDALTGLYNRRFIELKIRTSLQSGLPITVIFIDIDNFKMLNDTKGHKAGDQTLQHVAQLLVEEVEDQGFAGRYGGEEMIVLITDPSVHMKSFSEHIRSRIERETIVTVSVGYSRSKLGIRSEDLVRQADEAMYQAKMSGKNKVVCFDTESD